MTLAQQIMELMGRNKRVEMTEVEWINLRGDMARFMIKYAETLAQAVEAAKVLATKAVLLLNNAEGCARDPYGHDMSLYGLPGWLADSRERIMTARKALPTPPTKEDQNDGC